MPLWFQKKFLHKLTHKNLNYGSVKKQLGDKKFPAMVNYLHASIKDKNAPFNQISCLQISDKES